MAETREPAAPAASTNTVRRGRRTLILLALVALAPIVASYAAYYLFRHEARLNYGTLLPTAPAPVIDGTARGGAAFHLADLRGRWVLLVVAGERCDATCDALLYATRQARTMQGKEQERIERVLVVAADAPTDAALADAHPGLIVVRASAPADGGLEPVTALLIDPLGNQVLRYRDPVDIKGLARDLARLLKASRIG